MSKYSEKLRNPKWQRKRLDILQRDEFACVGCGDTESTLHVHHCYYEKGKEPWEYADSSLITLCEHCHSEEGSAWRDKSALVDALSMAGYRAQHFNDLACGVYSSIKNGTFPVGDDTFISAIAWLSVSKDAQNLIMDEYFRFLASRRKTCRAG